MIEAVVFDLDGLLLDTERLSRAGWQWALAQLGYELSDKDYEPCIGRSESDTCALWRERFGPDLSAESANTLRRQYMDKHLEGVPLKPGVLSLLDLLDARGIARAVATSSRSTTAPRKLQVGGLHSRIPVLVTSDLVAHGKPAPDLYLEAARRLGVAPEACLAFEDADGGVASAHAAGMTVFMVPDLKSPSDESRRKATILSSLKQVDAFLPLLPT